MDVCVTVCVCVGDMDVCVTVRVCVGDMDVCVTVRVCVGTWMCVPLCVSVGGGGGHGCVCHSVCVPVSGANCLWSEIMVVHLTHYCTLAQPHSRTHLLDRSSSALH